MNVPRQMNKAYQHLDFLQRHAHTRQSSSSSSSIRQKKKKKTRSTLGLIYQAMPARQVGTGATAPAYAAPSLATRTSGHSGERVS